MSAELPSQTLQRFDENNSWKDLPKEVLVADFLSASGESNLVWSSYFYEEKNGKLFDPLRKTFISGSANNDTVEENVINQIENWFTNNSSGIGVWISPRGNNLRPYPEEQITIYRIAYKTTGEKVLMFAWHQFKKEFSNPEEIRGFIFTEKDSEESIIEIINWLRNISEKPVANDQGDLKDRIKKANHYVDLYKSGVSMQEIAYQMSQTHFLGNNPIGCPTSSKTESYNYYSNSTIFNGYSFGNESTTWEYHIGDCVNPGCERKQVDVGPCNICKICEKKL